MEKVSKVHVDLSVAEFLRPLAQDNDPVQTPAFVRDMAVAFADAQAKRHDADYDLNKQLSEQDAIFLLSRVERAISQWRRAKSSAEKEIKNSLYLLMLLKGKLRQES